MGNISYFCIVKRFGSFLRYNALIIFLLLTFCGRMSASQDSVLLQKMDSVDISLLTCQPRQKIYSLYGHTAIRIEDRSTGNDWAVNYGLFSFDKPFFVLRFVFGLTDYEMGIECFSDFRREYERDGCGVWQQVISLSREDKLAIMEAIDTNYRPENRVYRYNYFYDNCTTRARDIIIRCMSGDVVYGNYSNGGKATFRSLTHIYNVEHPWARFGNDLLLGVKADMPIKPGQEQFLPLILSKELDSATVKTGDGSSRPLVTQAFWAIEPGAQSVGENFPLSPRDCMAIIAAVTLLFCLVDLKRGRISWGYDATMMLLTGLAGLILLAMVFSQHPTVSLNLQILLLNPLALVFLYPAMRHLRKGQRSLWLTIWLIFICLFLAGSIFQHYAEGMWLLASSLLTRDVCILHIIRKRGAELHNADAAATKNQR